MSEQLPKIHKGLAGLYVDTTGISNIDGAKGLLSYRGVEIEKLAHKDFGSVCFFVLFGRSPSATELQELDDFLFRHSELSESEVQTLESLPKDLHPMQVLQGMIPLINNKVKMSSSIYSEEACEGLVIAAKLPSLIAGYHRLSLGKEVLRPKKGLGMNGNFLYLFSGKLPHDKEVKTLDTVQILQMEHGFNASTYSARVTASTLAPVQVALSAAVGTLYGKLHGGADQLALEMAMEIGELDHVPSYVEHKLANKEKIMGMGHRVYQVVDPRAKVLKPMAKELCMGTPFEKNYLILEEIERVMGEQMMKKGKLIKANVEFYKGPVFYALGIAPKYFTSMFAMSRVYGYLAHILESRIDNKLIRPKAFYVGP